MMAHGERYGGGGDGWRFEAHASGGPERVVAAVPRVLQKLARHFPFHQAEERQQILVRLLGVGHKVDGAQYG